MKLRDAILLSGRARVLVLAKKTDSPIAIVESSSGEEMIDVRSAVERYGKFEVARIDDVSRGRSKELNIYLYPPEKEARK